MPKLLTIAIPTYNRAALLDKQLQRLHQEINGYEDEVQLVISNNQSDDNTADVIEKWAPHFSNLKTVTQKTNIGAVRNICWCLTHATTPFVWALSDDDPLVENTLGGILQRLKDNLDLAVMLLNYSSHEASTGKLQSPKKFKYDSDETNENGKALFAELIAKGNMGALVFTSALIYRSDYAREAITCWDNGYENLLFQLYITAACATQGRFLVTDTVVIRFMAGRSFFSRKTPLEIQMRLRDLPQTYAHFLELGYPRNFCKSLLVSHLQGKQFEGYRMWLRILKYTIRNPRVSLAGFAVLYRSMLTIWHGEEKPQTVELANNQDELGTQQA